MIRRALPWAVLVALAARLVARVSRYAVDLPFWDQWDFWQPLFDGRGPLTFFRWQHGPHRQGLGGLLLWASAHLSGYSARAEVFASCALVISGAALGLWLVQRVRGALDAWDVVVPPLLCGAVLADALTLTPNPAHGPVPFLLLLLGALAATLRDAHVRVAALAVLAPLTMYTGFGFLCAPFFLLLVALELRTTRAAWAALLLSAAACASFFVGWHATAAVACYRFPDLQPQRYAPFAALVLARPLGLSGAAGIRELLLLALVLPLLAAWAWGALRAPLPLRRVVLLLGGSALLFAASTAVGRVCLGLDAAAAPRYTPYIAPALVAAWLVVRELVASLGEAGRDAGLPGLRTAALAAVLLVCVVKEARAQLKPLDESVRIANGKAAMRSCLRGGSSASVCTRVTGFELYPWPEETHLDQKLAWLRARGLSPYR